MGADGAERRERLNMRLENMDNHLGALSKPKPMTQRGWITPLVFVALIAFFDGRPTHVAAWIGVIGLGLLLNFGVRKWQTTHDGPDADDENR